jgi:hypothetical protein
MDAFGQEEPSGAMRRLFFGAHFDVAIVRLRVEESGARLEVTTLIPV